MSIKRESIFSADVEKFFDYQTAVVAQTVCAQHIIKPRRPCFLSHLLSELKVFDDRNVFYALSADERLEALVMNLLVLENGVSSCAGMPMIGVTRFHNRHPVLREGDVIKPLPQLMYMCDLFSK